jgi:AraC family transcriptional regulator, exoenzyme S synthesis regulatory protein ExsA
MQKHNILYSYAGKYEKGHGSFLPEHILWLMLSGTMEVATHIGISTFGQGALCLVRKNQLIKATKKPEGVTPFKGIGIFLAQAFLKNYSIEHNVVANSAYTGETNVPLPLDPFMKGYFDSLMPYFEHSQPLTDALANAKTTEAIELLLRNPPLKDFLFDFNDPFKIDLESYMNGHFTYNVSLSEFAKLTGRSLSTFKRDFMKIFNAPPEKWLKKRRLERAHFLIIQEKRRPSDVYWEVGFANLSHFSDSFKEYFGYSPNEANRQLPSQKAINL